MGTLRIHLFGQLRVYGDERPLKKFPTLKTQHLFAYLVLHRHRCHSRNFLAGLFWGDHPDEQARKSLRTTLWRLRSLLEDNESFKGEYLTIEEDVIGFNTGSNYWLDVDEFEKKLSMPQVRASEPDASHLNRELFDNLTSAVELYQGELLEGCYEDWCLYEQQRLQELYLSALTRLMACHRSRGAYEEAIRCGQRVLSYDPLLEEVHREMMRLHCLAGNRGTALRQYRICQATCGQ